MRWARLPACALALFVMAASQTAALAMDNAQREIVQTVLDRRGYITETMHARFWEQVDPKLWGKPKSLRRYLAVLENTLVAGPRYDRERWLSVKATIDAGEVTFSPGYETAKTEMIEGIRGKLPRQRTKERVERDERLLEAVAAGRPAEFNGEKQVLAPDTVDEEISARVATLVRGQLLFKTVWAPEPRLRVYEEAGLSIRSAVPFVWQRREQVLDPDLTVNSMVFMSRVNADAFVMLLSAYYGGALIDPEEDLTSITGKWFKGMLGIAPKATAIRSWRGRPAFGASGSAVRKGQELHVSTLAVASDDNTRVLMFLANSLTSAADAEWQRLELEQATELLD